MSRAPMRRIAARLALCVTTALAAACISTSPKPEDVPQAVSPYGARATVTLLNGRSYGGELLAVTDSNVMLLADGRVATAPLGVVGVVAVADVGAVKFASGRVVSPELGQRARLVARYPYGAPAAALAALLAKTSQDAPDRLEARQ